MVDQVRVKKIDDESFMLGCLRMAIIYVKIVEKEIGLYLSREPRKVFDKAFHGQITALQEPLNDRILLHRKRLDKIIGKPAFRLKSRDLSFQRLQLGKFSKSGRLKKRILK